MMHQSRMIFIEGVPFTGKSTTSEYIATQLALNGYQARWLSEGMMLQHFPHAMAVIDREQPFSAATLRDEWRAFVEAALADTRTLVVDSALSYVAVAPLMTEDLPEAVIHAELSHIAALCAPLQPRVIHLLGDVEHLVPASIAERGAGWQEHLVKQAEAAPYQQARGRSGIEGAIRLLHDSQVLLDAALVRDAWPTLTLDVSAPERATHRRAILAFLGLEEVPIERPVLPPSVLQSYVGTYAAVEPERRPAVFSVQLEDEGLVLFGDDMRYGPLVPVSTTRFHLQATPVDFEFVLEDGVVRSLTVFRSDGTTHSYRRTG